MNASLPTDKRSLRRRTALSDIDHVIVGVRDLKEAAIAWRRLGFSITPRGRHVGWGTANHCIMFLGGYVELLGVLDPAQFTNNLDQFLKTREGLLSLAFATADADTAVRALRRAGIEVEAPNDLSRLLEVGEGDVTPRFRLVMLPPEATPAVSAFVCQHLTPELMRWPAWLTHPNGAVSLKRVAAVVEDPAALSDAYQRLLGAGALTLDGSGLHLEIGRSQLSFVTAAAFAGIHPGAAFPDVPPPYLAGLTLGVAQPAVTAQYFDDYGVTFSRGDDGALHVAPANATGAALRFEAA
jgi:hypothetical protein